MMGTYGIVSDSCLPYYIGGAGVEHFEHSTNAPPCETHCQGGYYRSIRQDSFSAPGMQNYDFIQNVHSDRSKHYWIMVSLYNEGPVGFSMQARQPFFGYSQGVYTLCTPRDVGNHAVVAYGWGVWRGINYLVGSNSWGTSWGINGHFIIHRDCVVDAFIPGHIQGLRLHSVDYVHPNVPRDPYNPHWPWPMSVERQCALDAEGCVNVAGTDYANNSTCVSDELNGKRIRVVNFNTESGYDILTVNGRHFTGSEEDVRALSGLIVDNDGLKFQTDDSVAGSGFKLCPMA